MLIGEVSRRSGVSARMLRHYESLELLAPAQRSSTGYREYTERDVERIFHIESLRSLGLSLQEVKVALDDPDFNPRRIVAELIAETRERLAQERSLLDMLRTVYSAGPEDVEAVLGIVDLLRGLRSSEPAQRQSAAFSAGAGLSPPAAEALATSALREEHLNVAGALSWAVLQSGEEALAVVARGLKSTDVEVRRRAVRILANATNTQSGAESISLELLSVVLDDVDTDVQSLAALALGKHGHTQAIPVLIHMILDGVRDVDAADTLSAIPGQEAHILKRFQEELASRDPTDSARARLTQALAEFDQAEELLVTLTGDANVQVALTATSILAMRKSQGDSNSS